MSEKTSFSTFSDYRQTVTAIHDDLLKLQGYCDILKLNCTSESISELLKKTAADSFTVAVVGEFRRGKSTLINSLLGKAILPSDVLPTTATLNRVTYAVTPSVKIEYKDNTEEQIPIEMLPDYVTKLTEEAEKRAESIRQATIFYPITYCMNNVDIIDTPGLNDDSSMTEVTLSVIPQSDAALFVIMAQSPFSEYERDFLQNKMLVSDIGRVIFVVTRIDAFDDEDADRVIQNISDRIKKYVVGKAEKVLGKDSREFQDYAHKLGAIKVLGVSAKQALKAKSSGDAALLGRSRFPAFERELEQLLTEERGAITLNTQVNRLLSASSEILKAADMRIGALRMGESEFQEKHEQAKIKIAEIRDDRDAEFSRIAMSAQKAYEEIRPQAGRFWQELIDNSFTIIENAAITGDDLKKENIAKTQEKLISTIQDSNENLGQLLSEKIQHAINAALGKEAERLTGFENNFYQSINGVQCQFSGFADNRKTVEELAISTAADTFLFMGLGGAYQGFKRAGWKGALLGGGIGFGATFGSILLLSALAIPFTWPVAIVAGFAGTIASRFALGKIFGGNEKQIVKFKEQFKEAIENKIREAQSANDMTAKLHEQINAAFAALKDKINGETESILRDTEAVLMDLQDKILKNRLLAEKETEELQNMIADVTSIIDEASELSQSIHSILNR